MPTKPELLDGGLQDAQDPVLMGPGALAKAQNARYRPGDSALYHAEGRLQLGAGSQSAGPITQFCGLSWDPGTIAAVGATELKQLLFYDSGLKSIHVQSSAGDPAHDVTRSYTTPGGVSVGSGPFVPIGIENSHVVLTGGNNLVFIRGDTGQSAIRHGLPARSKEVDGLVGDNVTEDGSDITAFQIEAETDGSTNFAAGDHYYWWTWYDSVNDVESAAEVDGVTFVRHTAAVTSYRHVFVCVISKFDGVVPAGADSIRVYKATPIPNLDSVPLNGSTPPAITGWPAGHMLAEVAFTANSDGNRFALASTTLTALQLLNGSLYYLLYEHDTQADEDELESLLDYESGAVAVAGSFSNYSLKGKPPRASTGDVLGEHLVLNDLDDPRKIRWSSPNLGLHAFPTVWFENFETAATDEVVAIRTLGNRLGVFLRNSVWRVNWLPTQADFDFSRGRIKDVVSEGLGTFSHYGVARFTLPGSGPMLAFLDRTGVYVTDLYRTRKLTERIDWTQIVTDPSVLNEAELLDDPNNERLVLRVGNNYWLFHYDETHLKDGLAAITGPIQRTSQGIAAMHSVVVEGGRTQIVSSDLTTSSLFYEGQGAGENLFVRTREIYPFGIGEEAELQRAYVHLKPSPLGGGELITRVVTGTAAGKKQHEFPPQPLQGRVMRPFTVRALGEYYTVEVVVSSEQAATALNFVAIDTESLREPESNAS